jgi:hypothetical protein
MIITDLFESPQTCPECGGPSFSDLILAEKKDACYHKVKASAKVWPSAYASGRLVQCRKKGADNYGNKNESQEQLDEKCWDGYQQQGMKNKSGRQVPNCMPVESVNEMDKSQTPPGRDGSNDDASKKEYTATPTTAKKVAKDGEKILNKELNKKQGVAEGSLEELANTSLKVKEPKGLVNTNDRKQVTYKIMKFKSGKDTYLINFTVKGAPAFGKKSNWNAVNVAFGVREEQDEYSFGDEMNTDLTARNKNQFLIYSTVINAIRKFITEYNTEIDEIIMQGAGLRQEAMYQRFFQSAGKYFPGWHHDGKQSLVRDVPRQTGKKVREQGVAEADNSNFVGFMNKTLADKVDSPKADPIAGAPDFYRNAAVATLDGRKGFKNALKFGLKALSRLDPETRQQLAAGSEQAVANYLTDVAERSGQIGDDTFVEEDISEVQDYLSDVFHDPSINSWKDVLQQSRTMSESQLDEKSVSQAQFRTMAAAAHNPEFAKKVGISQDVAQEFHSADKNSNYKKLPDRTNEEGERGRGRPMAGDWDPTAGKVGRVEKTPTGVRHHADPSRYGGTENDPELDRLDKGAVNKMDNALGVKWDRESKRYFSPIKVDETKPKEKETDYGDDYQDMVARVKKLAGLGPLKTVYDPEKRVYRNVPTAVQPKK